MEWTKKKRREYNQNYYSENKEVILGQTNFYKKSLFEKRKISLYHWAMTAYRNMEDRVSGRVRSGAKGKLICGRKDFYKLVMTNWQLKEVYTKWRNSGYDRQLSPSVDRINSNAGYTINNIQFLSSYDNSCKK